MTRIPFIGLLMVALYAMSASAHFYAHPTWGEPIYAVPRRISFGHAYPPVYHGQYPPVYHGQYPPIHHRQYPPVHQGQYPPVQHGQGGRPERLSESLFGRGVGTAALFAAGNPFATVAGVLELADLARGV